MSKFRVGLSSDFLGPDGSAAFPGFDLSALGSDTDIGYAYVSADGAFAPPWLRCSTLCTSARPSPSASAGESQREALAEAPVVDMMF